MPNRVSESLTSAAEPFHQDPGRTFEDQAGGGPGAEAVYLAALPAG